MFIKLLVQLFVKSLHVYLVLRNANGLEAWVEELSAVYDKKTLHQLYSIATEAPQFLVYKLNAER